MSRRELIGYYKKLILCTYLGENVVYLTPLEVNEMYSWEQISAIYVLKYERKSND